MKLHSGIFIIQLLLVSYHNCSEFERDIQNKMIQVDIALVDVASKNGIDLCSYLSMSQGYGYYEARGYAPKSGFIIDNQNQDRGYAYPDPSKLVYELTRQGLDQPYNSDDYNTPLKRIHRLRHAKFSNLRAMVVEHNARRTEFKKLLLISREIQKNITSFQSKPQLRLKTSSSMQYDLDNYRVNLK